MFRFKQFTIHQDRCAMKVTTDGCLFGAFVAKKVQSSESGVQSQHSVLDIGTGTGLLSLMLAQKDPDLRIDAVEIDPAAAEQAKENVEASPWKDRIKILNADIRNLSDSLPQYDIIISNPPFHEKQLASDLEAKNTAHHSKDLNLEEVLHIISAVMKKDGRFFLLLPFYRLEEVKKKIPSAGLQILTLLRIKQSVEHDFFRIIIGGSKAENKIQPLSLDMSVWDKDQQYTSDFKSLLKDYYLHLQ